jgi:hypothetical protein
MPSFRTLPQALVRVPVLLLLPTLVVTAATGACRRIVVAEGSGGQGGEGGTIIPVGGEGGGGSPADGGKDALDEFFDPGCPDAGPPVEDFTCDPYAQGNGDCFDGEGCYIYVQYPDDPCAQEVYGSYCAPQGFAGQGEPCNGGPDCLSGHVCVVTGSGTQCVELCSLMGQDGCPAGLVCEPIDVEGFGGCL